MWFWLIRVPTIVHNKIIRWKKGGKLKSCDTWRMAEHPCFCPKTNLFRLLLAKVPWLPFLPLPCSAYFRSLWRGLQKGMHPGPAGSRYMLPCGAYHLGRRLKINKQTKGIRTDRCLLCHVYTVTLRGDQPRPFVKSFSMQVYGTECEGHVTTWAFEREGSWVSQSKWNKMKYLRTVLMWKLNEY